MTLNFCLLFPCPEGWENKCGPPYPILWTWAFVHAKQAFYQLSLTHPQTTVCAKSISKVQSRLLNLKWTILEPTQGLATMTHPSGRVSLTGWLQDSHSATQHFHTSAISSLSPYSQPCCSLRISTVAPLSPGTLSKGNENRGTGETKQAAAEHGWQFTLRVSLDASRLCPGFWEHVWSPHLLLRTWEITGFPRKAVILIKNGRTQPRTFFPVLASAISCTEEVPESNLSWDLNRKATITCYQCPVPQQPALNTAHWALPSSTLSFSLQEPVWFESHLPLLRWATSIKHIHVKHECVPLAQQWL